MRKTGVKVDMHVHSKYSNEPAYWFLKKIGCCESYTEPIHLYQIARSRAMDLVTITDHDSILGNLEIAPLENTFISQEITTQFPENGCKVHVLAYGISESQHADIMKYRENVFDLVEYLNREQIFHGLAHPLFAVNDRLGLDQFEQCLLLFKNLELNGSRDKFQNDTLIGILDYLDSARIDFLSNKHDLAAYGENPWKKRLIGGSDDHCGMNIARTYTEFHMETMAKDPSASEFLNALERLERDVMLQSASAKTLAHTLYSIAFQFYEKKHRLDRYLTKSDVLGFFDQTLNYPRPGIGTRDSWLKQSIYRLCHVKKAVSRKASNPVDFFSQLMSASRKVLADENLVRDLSRGDAILQQGQKTEIWFDFAKKVSNRSLTEYLDEILDKLSDADFFHLLHPLSSASALYMMMAPYFLSYALFIKDRQFSKTCHDSLCGIEKGTGKDHKPQHRVAFFTDTFDEINGVAKAIRLQMEMGLKTGACMTLITCGPEDNGPNRKNFDPVDTYQMPEYPELKLHYPPFLEMLDFCYEQGYTHIHSETPGPVGLAALAISRILKIPFNGTYHTSLPETVRFLTEDTSLEDMTWKFIRWYFGAMDRVYVPSRSTARDLITQGIPESRITVFRRGIDIDFFNPTKRNGFFKNHYEIRDRCIKLLYVGRMSKEKNLKLLLKAFPKIAAARNNVGLIMVGDGPYLPGIRKALAGSPVVFTGYLEGEDLAQAYASADIFVFPSTTDTLGNVVLEAQASGLPVIVTEKGGPKENMVPDQTGFIFPSESPDALVDRILLLTDNPDLLSRMKQNARQYMKDRSVENMFQQFWNSYN